MYTSAYLRFKLFNNNITRIGNYDRVTSSTNIAIDVVVFLSVLTAQYRSSIIIFQRGCLLLIPTKLTNH